MRLLISSIKVRQYAKLLFLNKFLYDITCVITFAAMMSNKVQDVSEPIVNLIAECSFLPILLDKVVTILCSDGMQFWKFCPIYIVNQADPQW